MPEKETMERAREDAREGKSPSSQAGEFVREEMHHIREGETWCGFYEASDRDRALESAARGRKVESARQREDIRQNGGAGAP